MQKEDYDDPRMWDFLESANIRLLNDETVLIDNWFYLTGRKDPSRCRKMSDTRKEPDQLTASLDKTLPIIFMDHQPGQLDEVAAAGADLDLCGHTHDGQLFPLNIITGLVWEKFLRLPEKRKYAQHRYLRRRHMGPEYAYCHK
ncbi:MAG: hypothetical protein ACLSHW_01825 [Lachnospiraceae bacterium]